MRLPRITDVYDMLSGSDGQGDPLASPRYPRYSAIAAWISASLRM